MFVNPRDAFAPEDDEEPWYWSVLDEEPPDYCPPMLTNLGKLPGRARGGGGRDLSGVRRGHALVVALWGIDVPEGYVNMTYGTGWADKQLGPVLGLQPTHDAGVMGGDGPWVGTEAPPTPTKEESTSRPIGPPQGSSLICIF